ETSANRAESTEGATKAAGSSDLELSGDTPLRTGAGLPGPPRGCPLGQDPTTLVAPRAVAQLLAPSTRYEFPVPRPRLSSSEPDHRISVRHAAPRRAVSPTRISIGSEPR